MSAEMSDREIRDEMVNVRRLIDDAQVDVDISFQRLVDHITLLTERLRAAEEKVTDLESQVDGLQNELIDAQALNGA